MKISTSTAACEYLWKEANVSPLDTAINELRTLKTRGFDGADICFYSYALANRPLVAADWQQQMERLKHEADLCGIEATQAHSVIFELEDTENLEFNEQLMYRSIAAAGIFQVPWLVCHPFTIHDHIWYSYKESYKKNLDCFLRYGEAAAKAGVGLAIENMIENRLGQRRYCSGVDELIELTDALSSQGVQCGICWDTGHANLNSIHQPQALVAMGKRVKALHINDNRGQRDEHLAPLMGNIKWEPIMAALGEIGYNGDFCYEAQGYTNAVPASFHNVAMKYLLDLGQYMVNIAKEARK